MNKYLVAIFIALGLVSCDKHHERYYLDHPKELQEKIKECEAQKEPNTQCQEVVQLGARVSRLVFQLQSSPQGFGKKILALEQTIAQQKIALKQDHANQQLKAALTAHEQELLECLAVVKWLESPEGR